MDANKLFTDTDVNMSERSFIKNDYRDKSKDD